MPTVHPHEAAPALAPQEGRQQLAAEVASEIARAIESAARQLAAEQQRAETETETETETREAPFWQGSSRRRRDESCAVARREADVLRAAYSKGWPMAARTIRLADQPTLLFTRLSMAPSWSRPPGEGAM